jgi:hypothetical protein
MTMPSLLRFKLIAIIFLSLGTIISFAQCKQIDAVAKIVKDTDDIGKNQSIVLEIKGSNLQMLEVSLFGPNRHNILRTNKTEFNNLTSGKYLIVIAAKREKDNYCPKSINVTIN